jgi:hypothetical protein
VQQDDKSETAALRLEGPMTQEPNAITGVDEGLFGELAERVFPHGTDLQTRKNRLEVGVSEGKSRPERCQRAAILRDQLTHGRCPGSAAGIRQGGFSSLGGRVLRNRAGRASVQAAREVTKPNPAGADRFIRAWIAKMRALLIAFFSL